MVTISAKDGNFQVSVFRRHWSQIDLVIESLPNRRHVHHRNAARWTCVIPGLQQLLHALKVQHVTAFRDATRFPARVQILQADGAVGTGHLLDAFVVIAHRDS